MMIKITQPNGEDRFFENYHQVCDYINGIERRRESESGTKKAWSGTKKAWSFVRRQHETLRHLYYGTPLLKDILTQKEKEAVEKEMWLLEIVKGNREHVTQLLVTNRFDVEPLKRDWCNDYFLDCGLSLSEWFMKKT